MIQGTPGDQLPVLRVLIANAPVGLEEWLTQDAQKEEDIKIVASVQGYVEILVAAQMGVDVVVLNDEDSQRTPGICTHLLGEYPDIKILLISPSGDKAVLYWMGQRQKDLRLASPEALLVTLRQLDTLTNTV